MTGLPQAYHAPALCVNTTSSDAMNASLERMTFQSIKLPEQRKRKGQGVARLPVHHGYRSGTISAYYLHSPE